MVTMSEVLLPEFDREMARTRKVLAKVPADKMGWTAGDGLRTIGWNANHIADLVGWTRPVIDNSEFDIDPIDGSKVEVLDLSNPDEILKSFDQAVADARDAIGKVSDQKLAEPWSLKAQGQIMFTISKGECIRTWILNHAVHHRAILSIYLRLAGVELTPPYDE
ncbi:MAG: DinB family protein [Pirellulaceae bacterium]